MAASVVAALAAALPALAAPERPPGCRSVRPGEALQPLLDALPDGAALCLEPGDHDGPVRVQRRAVVWGAPGARIRSRGAGSTVSLEADGAALLGVSIDGSGGRFDQLDAAVRVRADGVRVEGVTIINALFGVLVEQSTGVVLRGNQVIGNARAALGMRGDGIRLWEVRGSRIENNHLRDSRDLVVWYSPGNHFEGNRIEGGRYGTHFMYSHDNTVVGNHYERNVVGIFVMYSRRLAIEANVLADSRGAAGVGLGAKESGALRLVSNRILGNHVGLYLDTSPLEPSDENLFEGNQLRFSDTAVVFHGRVEGNRFVANAFRDNHEQVRLEGRGDALAAEWRGNAFDDYVGYDLDGDGVGDVPYELRSLSGELTARRPALAFFRGGAALGLVELLGRVVPLFRAPTIVRDPAPRVGELEVADAR